MSDVLKRMIGVLLLVLLVSCGGGGGSSSGGSGDGGQQNDPGNDNGSYTPQEKNVERLVFLDANNQPLAGAEVKLLAESDLASEEPAAAKAATASAVYFPDIDSFPDFAVTGVFLDENGALDITGLAPGLYYVEVSTNGVIAYQVINIVDGNAVVLFSVVIPVSCNLDICEGVDAIVGSLSGQVYADDGPIEGAQVSLGTSATNGAYATTQTDAEGNYSLNFNVSAEFADELADSTLRVSAPGYVTVSRSIAVANGAASGANVELVELTESGDVIWRETFESNSLTRDAWQISGGDGETRWRYLMGGHGIANTLHGSHVQAAPGDQSEGKLPQPLEGQVSYWYGDAANGNFIGEQDLEGSQPFDGGLSMNDNDGMLESPAVDLSQVSAPIRLSFKTWWEIESVNPNENGFDLMVIQVSTDGGESFTDLARLNPLADPESSLERAPIPYSNTGFNKPPVAVQQEPVSLDAVAGESDVRLRFFFSTQDALYNGFRGWVLDDVVIEEGEGTFPLYQGSGEEMPELMTTVAKKSVLEDAPRRR